MKLEAGKFYKMRNGNKAFVVGLSEQAHSFKFIGTSVRGDFTDVHAWKEDGGFGNGEKDDRDLIAEWVEPKRIKGWVNIYNTPGGNYECGSYFSDKSEADTWTEYAERVACIEIDCLEGEGL